MAKVLSITSSTSSWLIKSYSLLRPTIASSALPCTSLVSWHTFSRPATVLTQCNRFRFLRGISSKRLLQVPVHAICVDSYGPVPHRYTGSFYDEQCVGGPHLVFPACFLGHHQRYLRLYLWNHLWPNSTHQDLSEENCRGLRGCMDLHHHNRICPYKRLDAIQVLHLPRE